MVNYVPKNTVRMAWTSEQIEELKLRFPNEDNQALCHDFGCTKSALRHITEKLNLKKSREYKAKRGRECAMSANRQKSEAERITAGMKKRTIFSGFIYTKGSVTVHIGR